MDKHVLTISFRLDEAEALCRVEKLHGTLRRMSCPFPFAVVGSARQLKSRERQMPEGERGTAAREAYSRVENTGF